VEIETELARPSPSIGRQGACSHHGGVVSVYEGSAGTVLRCHDSRPPDAYEQAVMIRDIGRVVC
jgi:hypothetical protein